MTAGVRSDGGVGSWSAEELLLRVSWYYYKDELTQDEIARSLRISRPTVSRLLERARKVGLVSINLRSEHLDSLELSRLLRDRFGLAEALVVPDRAEGTSTGNRLNARLAVGGAQYLATRLPAGAALGVGWGDTIAQVIAADEAVLSSRQVVTLTGGVDVYIPALARSRLDVADRAAGIIPAPIVASTAELATALSAEPTIRRVLESATRLSYAIVGIGTPSVDATLSRLGYMSEADAREISAQGAVGDILGQFFDIDGNVLDLELHRRRIGIELEDLRRIQTVIGVAGGQSKLDAILGVLRGRYVDVLVTDESTAADLLSRADAALKHLNS
jgi:lsr operon transcriptional repressor